MALGTKSYDLKEGRERIHNLFEEDRINNNCVELQKKGLATYVACGIKRSEIIEGKKKRAGYFEVYWISPGVTAKIVDSHEVVPITLTGDLLDIYASIPNLEKVLQEKVIEFKINRKYLQE